MTLCSSHWQKTKMLSCKNRAYLTLYCHLPIIQRFKLFFLFKKKKRKVDPAIPHRIEQNVEMKHKHLFSFFWVPVVWSLQTIMNNIHTFTQRKTNSPAKLTSLSSQNASLSFLFFCFLWKPPTTCCGRRCNVMMRRPFCIYTVAGCSCSSGCLWSPKQNKMRVDYGIKPHSRLPSTLNKRMSALTKGQRRIFWNEVRVGSRDVCPSPQYYFSAGLVTSL